MKKNYKKPLLTAGKSPASLVPIVAAVAGALGISQAVAGLGLGTGAVLAATAAKKALSERFYFDAWCRAPALAGIDE